MLAPRAYVGKAPTLNPPIYPSVLPDNPSAAAGLLLLVAAAALVHVRLGPALYAAVALRARRPLRVRRLLHALAHRRLFGRLSLYSLFPPLVLVALIVMLSVGSDITPAAATDIGNQRLGCLCLALVALQLFRQVLTQSLTLPKDYIYGELATTRNQQGIAGASLILFMVLTSTWIFRRYAYWLFHLLHILALPGLLTMIFLHAPDLAFPFFMPTLSLYFLDRAIRLLNACTTARVVDMKVWEEGSSRAGVSTIMLTISSSPMCDFKGFRSGQFVYVKVPEISSVKWHPLSFSTCPASNPKSPRSKNTFTVIHSGSGRFAQGLSKSVTARLLNADLAPLAVHLDGPYGRSQLDPYVAALRRFVFIAGGIGATPVLSMATDLVARMRFAASRDSNNKDIAQVESMAPIRGGGHTEVLLVWTVKHFAEFEWAMDALEDLVEGRACTCGQIAGNSSNEASSVHVRVLLYITAEEILEMAMSSDKRNTFGSEEVGALSEVSSGHSSDTGHTTIHRKLDRMAKGRVNGVKVSFGRPNIPEVFGMIRPHSDDNLGHPDCAVVVSGPQSLIAAVNSTAVRESDNDCVFHVFEESFEV
ncbi:ferric/cupric-chelate reductase [Entophlyctis luteolus]|nr:ferric/cupric-chelate reductase [Entophlyctis luteolus]